MKKAICDKCGTEIGCCCFDGCQVVSGTLNVIGIGGTTQTMRDGMTFDLCSTCADKMYKWVRGVADNNIKGVEIKGNAHVPSGTFYPIVPKASNGDWL